MLKLLPKDVKINSVLDLGCGMSFLKEVLSERKLFKRKIVDFQGIYNGVDLYPHKKETILCDFNAKQEPNLPFKNYDLIVAAGLFEYLYDLEFLAKFMAKIKPNFVLCSYNFKNTSKIKLDIWVDLLHQKKFFEIFFKQNFRLFKYESEQNDKFLQTGYFCFIKDEKIEPEFQIWKP